MELDDMKLAWQTLDLRLQRQHAMNLQLFRDNRIDRLRRGLRPLAWGQALQIVVGALGLLVLAPVWMPLWRDPAVLISGVVLHAYCIGLIVIGAILEAGIARIDHGEPVLAIQKRLLALRRTYVLGGLLLGLPWWFLTAPVLVVLTRGAIMHTAPAAIWGQLGVGMIGVAASIGFYRWARRPGRPRLGQWVERMVTGASLLRAQSALDEIVRFERE